MLVIVKLKTTNVGTLDYAECTKQVVAVII